MRFRTTLSSKNVIWFNKEPFLVSNFIKPFQKEEFLQTLKWFKANEESYKSFLIKPKIVLHYLFGTFWFLYLNFFGSLWNLFGF